jgi:hypothetical protein
VKRRILNVVSALSLLLLVATVTLWVVSQWYLVGVIRRTWEPKVICTVEGHFRRRWAI